VHVPNPFEKLSKTEKVAVIAGGSAILAFALYQHHKSTGSWSPFASGDTSNSGGDAAGGAGTVTDPVSGSVYSDTAVDPVTNLTYASEISQFGSVQAAESQYAATSYGGTGGTVTPSAYDTGYSSASSLTGTTTASGTNVYTSNSAWAQAVQAGLTDVSGSSSYDGTDIGQALGAYLTGQPLTAAQAQVVQVAIAEYGPAPVGNLQIIKQPVAQPSATPPPVTVPVAAPKPPSASPPNINISFTSRDLDVSYGSVSGATMYSFLFGNGHTAQVSALNGEFSSATVGHTGTVKVRAGNTAGWGPYSAPKTFTFPK
jgi:hypothetical protein